MKLRHLYLALGLIGLILPYWHFIPWLVEHHGFSPALFFSDLFANPISAFFAMDVIVSAVVLVLFMHTERRYVGIRVLWLATLATALVGVSLGFPLFLYLRQRALDNA